MLIFFKKGKSQKLTFKSHSWNDKTFRNEEGNHGSKETGTGLRSGYNYTGVA